ncbi:hypothetical protein VST7929_02766 [Vibrio stylophorae]|uniref:Isoprenylcysteine carboxyl methyltransferase n=1 Tax=Vibrio stylophorae TaxID=659351 RepID=A0ABM8ZWW1_9VIBR|nr:isoprenylcysteine carboxylmethyltransferase family protein [Vibrio stylophorae]CAH0535105.1 hypothetical protein VST7929_02766 [Vibrio stylophorae]
MSHTLLALLLIIFTLRIATVVGSIRNVKRMKAMGGVEYGKTNSRYLTLLHTAFYFGAIFEAMIRQTQWQALTYVGLGFYLFSMLALALVIYCLWPVWSIKLVIVPNHQVVANWLFRAVRHPNYFLNILPELIGVVLMTQAYFCALILTPLYLWSLRVRIAQEEKVMRQACPEYQMLLEGERKAQPQ